LLGGRGRDAFQVGGYAAVAADLPVAAQGVTEQGTSLGWLPGITATSPRLWSPNTPDGESQEIEPERDFCHLFPFALTRAE
jgi:hypothetical protein